MRYAKITEAGTLDILYRVPNVTNPTPETFKKYAEEHGFYPVKKTDAPSEWYAHRWEQEGDVIVQKWVEYSNEEKAQEIQMNIQLLLDSTAAERNYDNIFTALTYIDSKNLKFAKEAAALKEWRDTIWTECYAYLALVEKGEATIPDNWAAVAEMLPKFEWPE